MVLAALIGPRITPASAVNTEKPLHSRITLQNVSHVKKNHKTPSKKKKSALFVTIHLILMFPLLRVLTGIKHVSIIY